MITGDDAVLEFSQDFFKEEDRLGFHIDAMMKKAWLWKERVPERRSSCWNHSRLTFQRHIQQLKE